MKLEFDEKTLKQTIEKKMKKKYRKTLKSSSKLNLMFNSAFSIINKTEFSNMENLKVNDLFNNGKEEVKTMINFVKDYFNGTYRDVEKGTILIVCFGIFYLVEPIDGIADFLPVVGYSDDLALLTMILTKCQGEYNNYKEFLKQNINQVFGGLIIKENMELILSSNDINLNDDIDKSLEIINDELTSETENIIEKMLIINQDKISAADYKLSKNNIEFMNDLKIETKNINPIKLNEFFNYNHADYSRIIYQLLYREETIEVELTTEMIKKSIIDPIFFDYEKCIETMINNQSFDRLEKELCITKPYKRIIDSDRKQSIKGNYYIVKYEKNMDISDYFENLDQWDLLFTENLNDGYQLIKYQTNQFSEFNKEIIESLITHVGEYINIIKGIFIYEITTHHGNIKITIDLRTKLKCKVELPEAMIKDYYLVLDYLELNLAKIIDSRMKIKANSTFTKKSIKLGNKFKK